VFHRNCKEEHRQKGNYFRHFAHKAYILRRGKKKHKLQGNMSKVYVICRSQCCKYNVVRHLLYTERSGDKKQAPKLAKHCP